MKMTSTLPTTIYPGNACPSQPRKFETRKSLKYKSRKRRNISITDGIVTPWMLCTPQTLSPHENHRGAVPAEKLATAPDYRLGTAPAAQ